MSYQRSQMLYDNGSYYKWSAAADKDDPLHIQGNDYREMDKTQGYEVLPFINRLVDSTPGFLPTLTTYHKIEKMIRYDIPPNVRSHADKRAWIIDNWHRVS